MNNLSPEKQKSVAWEIRVSRVNRTEEHWGPQELTMDVAMRLP